jgi:hypothetical protein
MNPPPAPDGRRDRVPSSTIEQRHVANHCSQIAEGKRLPATAMRLVLRTGSSGVQTPPPTERQSGSGSGGRTKQVDKHQRARGARRPLSLSSPPPSGGDVRAVRSADMSWGRRRAPRPCSEALKRSFATAPARLTVSAPSTDCALMIALVGCGSRPPGLAHPLAPVARPVRSVSVRSPDLTARRAPGQPARTRVARPRRSAGTAPI